MIIDQRCKQFRKRSFSNAISLSPLLCSPKQNKKSLSARPDAVRRPQKAASGWSGEFIKEQPDHFRQAHQKGLKYRKHDQSRKAIGGKKKKNLLNREEESANNSNVGHEVKPGHRQLRDDTLTLVAPN